MPTYSSQKENFWFLFLMVKWISQNVFPKYRLMGDTHFSLADNNLGARLENIYKINYPSKWRYILAFLTSNLWSPTPNKYIWAEILAPGKPMSDLLLILIEHHEPLYITKIRQSISLTCFRILKGLFQFISI